MKLLRSFNLLFVVLCAAASGYAQTATTHSAKLTITAATSSTGAAVVGPITIFRASVACPSGTPPGSVTWQVITTAANPGPYTDALPAAGTYCYYVTQQGVTTPSNMAGGTTSGTANPPSITVTVQ